MNIYEQVERLLADGAFSEAEGVIAGLLAQNARDALGLTLLGALRAVTGRFPAAIEVLERATAIDPSGFGALFMLAQALQKMTRAGEAAPIFVKAAAAAPSDKLRNRALLGAVRCFVDTGRPREALGVCVEAGLLPAAAMSAGPAFPGDADIPSISDTGLSALLYAMYGAGDYEGVRRLGPALAGRGDNLRTNAVLAEVAPVSLLRLGRVEEAAEMHLRILKAGGRTTDFRPSWPRAQLARVNPPLAGELYRRDLRDFQANPDRARSAPQCAPRPGAHTLAAAVAGPGGVVFRAEVASRAVGAAYRFEYGPGGGALVNATPWRDLPAPLGGAIRERAYRAPAWHPQSTQFSWVVTGAPQERAAARLTAPFSTDRNHLSGIGACDLVIGLGQPGKEGADLRDAEVSFTMRADDFTGGGACLTLWAARDTADAEGAFCSQWALTGDAVPSAALMSGTWTPVRLRLSGDPAQWTYVGNNPMEQGPRAERYRRLPFGDTLSQSNHPLVLLFALGNEHTPPAGSIEIFDLELRHRVSSILSAAAGAASAESPESDMAGRGIDVLTDGSRGCDASLWTSAPAPEFPLVFRWTLTRPVQPTWLRIDQHPFYPAKDAEVWITLPDGGEQRVWHGTLPEAWPDQLDAMNITAALPATGDAVGITLKILSGYRPGRCGLDSIHVAGDGARFTGDGRPCNVSEEVRSLTSSILHYRVVVREDERIVAGETLNIELPAVRAPVFQSIRPLMPADGAGYMVRANAMGLQTELWGELRVAGAPPIKAHRISLGSESTGRHIIYVPPGLPHAPGTLTLRARNAEGEAALDVPWPPGKRDH